MLSEHTYTPSLNSTAMVTEPQGTSNGTALDNSEEIGERHGQQPQPSREKEEEEVEQRELESAVAVSRRPESQNLSSVVLPVLDQVSLQWFVIHSVVTLIIITFGRMTTLLPSDVLLAAHQQIKPL